MGHLTCHDHGSTYPVKNRESKVVFTADIPWMVVEVVTCQKGYKLDKVYGTWRGEYTPIPPNAGQGGEFKFKAYDSGNNGPDKDDYIEIELIGGILDGYENEGYLVVAASRFRKPQPQPQNLLMQSSMKSPGPPGLFFFRFSSIARIRQPLALIRAAGSGVQFMSMNMPLFRYMNECQMNVSTTGKALICGVVIGVSACSSQLRYSAVPQTGLTRTPEITIDNTSSTASLEITVLIYNVAGLPWPFGCGKTSRDTHDSGERIPVACNRSAALKKIGDKLGVLRQQGIEPDIVMLQEAFITAASEIPARGGYPNWVAGPGTRDLGPKYSERASNEFIAERSFWKGEKLGKRQSSGLLLASNFPIMKLYNHPFNQWECAGFDCLANKGLLVAELDIPGLPDYLAVATTHFNSRGASGVSGERSLIAHNLQVEEANEFLENLGEEPLPFIWGGDLNMRHADDRIRYFVNRSGGTLNEVSSYCVKPGSDCEIPMRWDSDIPWYETQDLQGWAPGTRVNIKPFRVEVVFDVPTDGIMLSDHNGLLVYYRLSWSTDRFAWAGSSDSRATSRILQMFTSAGTTDIFRKIRTPPLRDRPALPYRP